SHHYLCPWVMAIQAMLPAVLKGKTEKWLTATPLLTQENAVRSPLLHELLRKGMLPLAEVEKSFESEYPLIPGWIQAGWLTTEYQVKDKITRKQVAYASLLLPPQEAQEALQSLPKRSEPMKRVLEHFLQFHGQPFSVKELMETLD
ncbi:hypothetical protein MXD81_10110, partial [Microbacteriaceae bacterium K1510]|nr:hypothetical protein [Microbacteriaceae bacterium K1510]